MQKKFLTILLLSLIILTSCSKERVSDNIILENAVLEKTSDNTTNVILTQDSVLKDKTVGELKLNSDNVEVRKVQTVKPVQRIIKKQTADYNLNTNIIAVETIKETSADITLEKNGVVNTIFYCPSWDFNNKECLDWQQTNIPFTQDDANIYFTVPHFTAYAGGYVNYTAGVSSTSSDFVNTTNTSENITLILRYWNLTYNITNSTDAIFAFDVDSSAIYIGVYSPAKGTDIQKVFMKINITTGGVIWNVSHNMTSTADVVQDLVVDSTGIYAVGMYGSGVSSAWAEKRSLTDGSLIWNYTYSAGSTNAVYNSVVVDSTYVYIGGTDYSADRARVEKRNLTNGNSIWNYTRNISGGGSSSDTLNDLAIDSNALYLGGGYWNFANYWHIQKLNLNTGAEIVNANSSETLNTISVDSTGIYASGKKLNPSTLYNDWRIEKRNISTAISIWNVSKNYSAIFSSSADIVESSIDSSGLYILGYYKTTNYSLEKLNLTNGASIWNKSLALPRNNSIYYGVVVDSTNVYVAGYDNAPGTGNEQLRVEKRSLNDGSLESFYYSTGTYTSSLDAGQPVVWSNIYYTNNTPLQTSITYQVATSDDGSTFSSFLGPDKTSSTYYNTSGQTINISNSRYLKYIFYLSTTSVSITPTLSNITVKYYYPTTYNGTETTEGTFLKVWDDSDLGYPKINTEMKFYANYSNSTSALNFNNAWINMSPSSPPISRYSYAMAYDSDNKIIVMNGGAGAFNGETWIYNYSSNTWTNMSPSNSPPNRYHSAMVYDSDNKIMVMYGGASGFNDTWVYNFSSNTWTNMSPLNPPTSRFGHAMAYDSYNKLTVVYGGWVDSNNGEIWTYNFSLNTWTNMSPSSPPSERQFPAMAYDSDNKVMVMYGGLASGVNNETWIYNLTSNTWTNKNPSSPPRSRDQHAMAYDSDNKVMIMHGGGYGLPLGDTWKYNLSSNTWTNMSPSSSPKARYYHEIAYDSYNKVMILYGGYDQSVALNDTRVYTFSSLSKCELLENSTGSWSSSIRMSYNSTTNLSYYNKIFNVNGTFNYNITCSDTSGNHNTLSILDSFSIYKNLVYLNNNILFGKNVRIKG